MSPIELSWTAKKTERQTQTDNMREKIKDGMRKTQNDEIKKKHAIIN